MKIIIGDIIKSKEASKLLNFKDSIFQDNNKVDEFEIDRNIQFDGKIENLEGILKLTGSLKVNYKTICYRCLIEIEKSLKININESLFPAENKSEEVDVYFFESNFVNTDKIFEDNVILALPDKMLCLSKCKGICIKCGNNLNEKECRCNLEKEIDPRLRALKNIKL